MWVVEVYCKDDCYRYVTKNYTLTDDEKEQAKFPIAQLPVVMQNLVSVYGESLHNIEMGEVFTDA